jgi:hypothetical protein
MTIQIRASKHQLADLKRIVEIGPSRLHDIRLRLQEKHLSNLRPQELLKVAGEVIDEDDAELLVRQLLSLHGIVRQSGATVEDVVDGIRIAFEQQGESVGFDPAAWSAVDDELKLLVADSRIRLAATAIELAYDYANLLRRTRILTDIRPLYNDPADVIEGAVVSYTLRLRFDSADGEHELSIALDESDVRTLQEQCGRALKKAETACSAIADKLNIPIMRSGEAKND